jgi:hypothetical protein
MKIREPDHKQQEVEEEKIGDEGEYRRKRSCR